MYENKIVLVDLFDGLGEEASFLVYHLSISDDLGLDCRTFMVLFFELREVLIGEDLIVEGNRILI